MKSNSREERQTYLRSILLGTAIGASLPWFVVLGAVFTKEFTGAVHDTMVLSLMTGVGGFLLGSSHGRRRVQKRRQLTGPTNAESTENTSAPIVSLVCPQCGSPDAQRESALTRGWLESSRVCRRCQTLYLAPMKLPVVILYFLGGLLLMSLAVAIIYRGWRMGIATQHAFLLEVFYYIPGCAIAKVAWTPLQQGFCGLRQSSRPP